MPTELQVLIASAATIGFMHTILGPDHYLPFIALAKAGSWSPRKTLAVTLLCGAGHVLGSVLLGLAGIVCGVALFKLEVSEAVRGEIASWLLLGFGLAYLVWGIRHGIRHGSRDHAHGPPRSGRASRRTPWLLFLIFVFGPCEPLIPLLMVPAAQGDPLDVVLVVGVFGLVTLLTMTVLVMSATAGLGRVRARAMHRYAHALAGLVIVLCGVAMTFFEL